MTTLSAYLAVANRSMDENSGDDDDQDRLKDWINELLREIAREQGIAGLYAQGTADFEEDDTYQALTIATAHNTDSRVVRITKAWLEQFEYDSGWVSADTKYRLDEISYDEYCDRMISSDDTGTPVCWAMFNADDDGQPNVYLYPPPDSDDTEDSTGKRWRLHFLGEADIGAVSEDTDEIYPYNCDDILTQGLRWKQADYDDKPVEKVMYARNLFKAHLGKFKAVENYHHQTYVFKRGGSAHCGPRRPGIPETLPGP